MRRIVLVHWKPAEAEPKAETLRKAGYEVTVIAPQGSPQVRGLTQGAVAVVIDLSRLPLQGRAVAVELRKRAESRHVPILFAGGTPEKLEAVRALLPDAGFCEWDNLPEGLEKYLQSAPVAPAVPDTMAGYSGSPLPKKLGIRARSVVALLGAPAGFEAELVPLPEDVKFTRKPAGASRVLLFTKAMRDLERQWPSVTSESEPGATIWVVWPKKASGVQSDVTEQDARAFGLSTGWVDYKICAVNAIWSGLAFARRKAAAKGAK